MVESQAEWEAIIRLLHRCGIVRIIPDGLIPRGRGRRLLQGAFGVGKPGKTVSDGRMLLLLLRFIMGSRATNAVMSVLKGDLQFMAAATFC